MDANEPPAPSIAQGMRRVSYTEFHASICPRNVHPRPEGPWRKVTGYTTEWRDVGGRALRGVSDGDGTLMATRYWLPS